MNTKGILEEQAGQEPPGDPSSPDNTPAHENAEPPQMEQQEGGEEDGVGADKAYQTAVDAVQKKLYDDGVAEGIAKSLLKSSDPVKGVTEQAQMLFQMADEATGGTVPDSMYLAFGMQMLTEVIEIAQAAGIQLDNKAIATGVRDFLISTVENLGGDTSQVNQALSSMNMDEVGAQIGGGE